MVFFIITFNFLHNGVGQSLTEFDELDKFAKNIIRMMKLSLALLEDIEKNKDDRLNIEKAIKGLNRPLFIAHGDQDISVPFREARDLYGWANKDITSFLEIPATGHTFDAVHPFTGSNPKFDLLLDKTNSFFNKYL